MVKRKAGRVDFFCRDVDLNKSIVTVQREMSLIAAVQDRGDGKLLTSIYRPLCEKSTRYLIDLSFDFNEDENVNRRRSNWEYALDSSAGMGNAYASEREEAYLSYWEYGQVFFHAKETSLNGQSSKS